MSTSEFDREGFIQEYVESQAWKDGRDPETCRENAKKYSVSLVGTEDRLGWFEWLDEERDKSAEQATTGDVRAFLLYLQEKGLSGPSQTQARSGISQYYQLSDIDSPNPVAGLDGSWRATTDKENATGEKRVYLSKEEIESMIENVPEPTLRSELIIKLLYQTGIRRMELATIEIERLNLEDREIQVYADKTDEWRTVGFRSTLRNSLNLWIQAQREDEVGYHEDNPYLFPAASTRGESDHISGETIRKTVVDAADRAGIQEAYGEDATGKDQNKVVPHSLRHAFAVHSAENGVPAPHLQTILGHHSLDITQIYAEIADQDAVDMLKKRGPDLTN